jgi:hypothetical protein
MRIIGEMTTTQTGTSVQRAFDGRRIRAGGRLSGRKRKQVVPTEH